MAKKNQKFNSTYLALWKKYHFDENFDLKDESKRKLYCSYRGDGIFNFSDEDAVLIWQFLRKNKTYKKIWNNKSKSTKDMFCVNKRIDPDIAIPNSIEFNLNLNNTNHLEKIRIFEKEDRPKLSLGILLNNIVLDQLTKNLKKSPFILDDYKNHLPKFQENKVQPLGIEYLLRSLFSLNEDLDSIGRNEARSLTEALGENLLLEYDLAKNSFHPNSNRRKNNPYLPKQFADWKEFGEDIILLAPFCFFRQTKLSI